MLEEGVRAGGQEVHGQCHQRPLAEGQFRLLQHYSVVDGQPTPTAKVEEDGMIGWIYIF
jgi:hypothetical protein